MLSKQGVQHKRADRLQILTETKPFTVTPAVGKPDRKRQKCQRTWIRRRYEGYNENLCFAWRRTFINTGLMSYCSLLYLHLSLRHQASRLGHGTVLIRPWVICVQPKCETLPGGVPSMSTGEQCSKFTNSYWPWHSINISWSIDDEPGIWQLCSHWAEFIAINISLLDIYLPSAAIYNLYHSCSSFWHSWSHRETDYYYYYYYHHVYLPLPRFYNREAAELQILVKLKKPCDPFKRERSQ